MATSGLVFDTTAVISLLSKDPLDSRIVAEDLIQTAKRLGQDVLISAFNYGEVFSLALKHGGVDKAYQAAAVLEGYYGFSRVPDDANVTEDARLLAAGHNPQPESRCYAYALARRMHADIVTADLGFKAFEDGVAIRVLPGVGAKSEREVVGCGERWGQVDDVEADVYHVSLYTLVGWRHYSFPKSFSRDRLSAGDSVRCYVVNHAGSLQSRLQKYTEPPIDEKAVRAAFDKLLLEDARKRGWLTDEPDE